MKDTMLLEVLPKLSHDELKIVQQFLAMKYFNNGPRRQQTTKLWEYLVKLKPNFDDPKRLDTQRVCKAIGVNTARELTFVTSELLAVVKKVLLYEHLENKNEAEKSLLLADEFAKRGLNSLFLKAAQQTQRAIDKNQQYTSEYSYTKWQLETLQHRYTDINASSKKHFSVLPVSENFDTFYLINGLRYEIELFVTASFSYVHVEKRRQRVQAFSILISTLPTQDDIINILMRILLLFQNQAPIPSPKFRKLVDDLLPIEAKFPKTVLAELHSYLRSYASTAYNKGQIGYLEELFQLQKHHLSAATLTNDDGQILSAPLQNILAVALKLGYHQWAFDTLEHYKNRISSPFAQQVYAYNKANCLFHLQQFDEALTSLPDTYQDIQTDINAKRLRIKIYYETASELLPYALDTFAVNDIFRNQHRAKYSASVIESNNNFLKMVRALIALPPKPDPSDLVSLFDRIQKITILADKEWLLQVIQKRL